MTFRALPRALAWRSLDAVVAASNDMNSELYDLQMRLRADALDRIRPGYDLVESGMRILAVLSIPDTSKPIGFQDRASASISSSDATDR